MSLRVLVSGGEGFIGSHVVDRLAELGHEVVVLDSLEPSAHGEEPDYRHPRATYVRGNVEDVDAWRACLAGVDAVSHQAAKVGLGVDMGDVLDYVRANDVGTAAMLRAMHEARFSGRVVLASSMAVYGEGRYRCPEHGPVPSEPRAPARLAGGRFEPTCPECGRELSPEPVSEEAAPDPRNVYAATKLHQEHLCFAYGREMGTEVVALRYHNVYGPRMPRDTPYAGVASVFRSALAAGESPRVFEDGGQRRDFVHVRDVAAANVLALTAQTPVGGPFNVASGEPHTVGEMAEALASAFGSGAPRPVVTGEYRPGDVRHVFASPARAADLLGFHPDVGFDEGMRELAGAPLRPSAASVRAERSR
ncbi:MAG TPA: NAD-dependent epimerase/dehydratase family protein [Actinomycetota bacterium]